MSTAAIKNLNPASSVFDYDLPEALIAQHPLPERSASRLLHLAGEDGGIRDLVFPDIVDLLEAGDVLVFNDTRVIPARLFGRKSTGGRVELLLERILDGDTILAQSGSSKPLRAGQRLTLEKGADAADAMVAERRDDLSVIRFLKHTAKDVLERLGHVPLPPYIQRTAMDHDLERYQTVYARTPGAVAAPTAGLHFDDPLMDRLRSHGVKCEFLTLHVGAGTFQPIRAVDPMKHRMHPEWVSVPRNTGEAVAAAGARGNKVVAVGTTCVRALETMALERGATSYEGSTDLFLYPGRTFNIVDAMITNFHLPRSSLLMLVCAFAGTDDTLRAYRHAVDTGYRFYSYGDAMFVTRSPAAGTC
jgi:S-adenosylmethionine:tRNA ribosyltransferase-isomerase